MTARLTDLFIRGIFAVFLGLLLLNGCGSDPEKEKPEAKAEAPKPKIRELRVDVVVAKEVNPDIDGRPSPIVLRVYELKDLGKFEVGDFFQLFDDYEAALGADLVTSTLFHLQPGDRKSLKQVISDDTRFLAAAAAYRDLNRAVWREVKPIRTDSSSRFEIKLEALGIGINESKCCVHRLGR